MAFGWDDAIAAGLRIVDKFVPDPKAQAEAKLELERLFNSARLAQVNLNAEEVKSGHLLGKWRGFLGWALAAALVYQLIIYPSGIALFVFIDPSFDPSVLPVLELKQLGSLLLGMLGLGA